MASWDYAFLFPSSGQRLDPASAIGVFSEYDLEFDQTIRPLVAIDEDGHHEGGEEIELTGSILDELRKRLFKGEQFQTECRNTELFFTCIFDTGYSNPHVVLAWSRRLLRGLGELSQQAYWKMLRDFAKRCKATYVIIVNDPPDFFEDRFLEIDGQRFLEKVMPSGNEYDIHSVWIDANSSDRLPEGIDEALRSAVGDGFLEYSV